MSSNCSAVKPTMAPKPRTRKVKKETLRAPTPPPIVNVTYERASTPEQEYIERVNIYQKIRRF